MNAPSAKIFVSVGDNAAFVKITGRANFTSSIDFKTLLNELLQKGYASFVLDLSECVLMDSTFLGVLAGFGLRMNTPQPDHIQRSIELFNLHPRISELLENLGVLHLFKVVSNPAALPDRTQPHDHTPAQPTQEEVMRTCLEAHQTLMNINPANVSRFKEVTQFLAEDLKKLKAAS